MIVMNILHNASIVWTGIPNLLDYSVSCNLNIDFKKYTFKYSVQFTLHQMSSTLSCLFLENISVLSCFRYFTVNNASQTNKAVPFNNSDRIAHVTVQCWSRGLAKFALISKDYWHKLMYLVHGFQHPVFQIVALVKVKLNVTRAKRTKYSSEENFVSRGWRHMSISQIVQPKMLHVSVSMKFISRKNSVMKLQ